MASKESVRRSTVAWSARGMTVPLRVMKGWAARSSGDSGGRAGGGGWPFRSVTGAVMKGCGFGGQRGECVELRRFELDVARGGVGVELVGSLGADDDRGDGRAGQQPCQRHLVGRQPPGTAESLDLPGERDLGVAEACSGEALVAGDVAVENGQVGQQATM